MRSFVYIVSGAELLSTGLCSTSFEVRQKSTGKFGNRGAQSLAQAYKRYGASVHPEMEAEAAAQCVSGSVPAIPNQGDEIYASPINIGGQTLNVQFDTGSSDLWVYSTLTPACMRGGRTGDHLYDPRKSNCSKPLPGLHWDITYGSGHTAGIVYQDDVSVGGITAPGLAVDIPMNVSRSFYSDHSFDGLLGLGPNSVNSIKPTKQTTWFAAVYDKLARPFFAVDLKHQAPGTFTFGGLPNGYKESDIEWIDVDGSWTVEVNEWAIGDHKPQKDTIYPIVDSGTPYLLLSPERCGAFYANVRNGVYDRKHGYVYDCDQELPDLSFTMGNFTATVPGKVLRAGRINETTCHGGLQPIAGPGVPPAIFGDTFMKSTLTVFQVDEHLAPTALGFASKDCAGTASVAIQS